MDKVLNHLSFSLLKLPFAATSIFSKFRHVIFYFYPLLFATVNSRKITLKLRSGPEYIIN